ncbi:hypothetical protein SynA15127_02227 [Synechococcus sp. A15-127]|uniref:DUF3086 domain-containing protein n=1 Tax=Synechococcus sp. A15-127 TaxID=1050624 RepID=UPI0016456762|nr:DUF3086 domain-containing protein [Synechococcus sp. A15-127]QNI95291.1 hypothetical protein SynA15127_02227 [Synechococcus sp. A15-127]
MERTAADAMPDDTDLTPQEPEPAETTTDTSTETSTDTTAETDANPVMALALKDLQERRDALERDIQELTNRKQQLEADLKTSFAGQSDAIARRVKGFQEYLGGALQDLVQSVESLELVVQPMVVQPSPLDQKPADPNQSAEAPTAAAAAVADTFRPDEALIRAALERFLKQPDVYADPWNLRRSIDAKDIALLEDWFFNQGGRGAQPSRGTRPRNILASAALIAIIGELYGDQFQCLVLAGGPERLGEWRRGLQDALGLGREDFGPSSGIVLFERPEALVERADRLEERGEVPLILIDAAERSVDIPVLQFPLWLAFAAGPGERLDDDDLL